MLKQVVDAGLLVLSDFREWPVFKPLRSNEKFIEAFERAFGERLFLDAATTRPESEGSSADVEKTAGSQRESAESAATVSKKDRKLN